MVDRGMFKILFHQKDRANHAQMMRRQSCASLILSGPELACNMHMTQQPMIQQILVLTSTIDKFCPESDERPIMAAAAYLRTIMVCFLDSRAKSIEAPLWCTTSFLQRAIHLRSTMPLLQQSFASPLEVRKLVLGGCIFFLECFL